MGLERIVWRCFAQTDERGVHLEIKRRVECTLDVVNIEFDTEPRPCMFIWVQKSISQPTERLDPKHHWKFDVSAIFVSPLLW